MRAVASITPKGSRSVAAILRAAHHKPSTAASPISAGGEQDKR